VGWPSATESHGRAVVLSPMGCHAQTAELTGAVGWCDCEAHDQGNGLSGQQDVGIAVEGVGSLLSLI
jgi:hypothetical protein